jgi:hypothetical protein
LVSDIKGRTQTEGVSEQGAEETIWTEERRSDGVHNEELHNLCSSPSIIRTIKSRRMRWSGHVAPTGRSAHRVLMKKKRRKETARKT